MQEFFHKTKKKKSGTKIINFFRERTQYWAVKNLLLQKLLLLKGSFGNRKLGQMVQIDDWNTT